MNRTSLGYFLNLPIIEDLEDFSNLINLSKQTLFYLTNNIEQHYKSKTIKKKNGTNRFLSCPSTEIKALQSWILRNILDKIPLDHSATAFRKGFNLKNNVEKHLKNNFIIKIDIKDFFDSIPSLRVYTFFKSLGYNKFIAFLLTKICSYNNCLPQGGVTSPTLSNIICTNMDRRIIGYLSKRNVTYTRYADDMIFSSNKSGIIFKAIEFVKKIIKQENFVINEEKFKVIRPGDKRLITGLIINDNNEIRIGKERKKFLRAMIYNFVNNKSDNVNQIKGWLAFLHDVDLKTYEYLINYQSKLNNTKK